MNIKSKKVKVVEFNLSSKEYLPIIIPKKKQGKENRHLSNSAKELAGTIFKKYLSMKYTIPYMMTSLKMLSFLLKNKDNVIGNIANKDVSHKENKNQYP